MGLGSPRTCDSELGSGILWCSGDRTPFQALGFMFFECQTRWHNAIRGVVIVLVVAVVVVVVVEVGSVDWWWGCGGGGGPNWRRLQRWGSSQARPTVAAVAVAAVAAAAAASIVRAVEVAARRGILFRRRGRNRSKGQGRGGGKWWE